MRYILFVSSLLFSFISFSQSDNRELVYEHESFNVLPNKNVEIVLNESVLKNDFYDIEFDIKLDNNNTDKDAVLYTLRYMTSESKGYSYRYKSDNKVVLGKFIENNNGELKWIYGENKIVVPKHKYNQGKFKVVELDNKAPHRIRISKKFFRIKGKSNNEDGQFQFLIFQPEKDKNNHHAIGMHNININDVNEANLSNMKKISFLAGDVTTLHISNLKIYSVNFEY